ncbi:hypothetical protein [Nesterenkonia sandarakina]|uniref:Uncharacterized protein n=1 Tax=Nesterenkonia sandarakina TaxID=272918 RepID=A0A7Z0E682_9MICC|nr:hypothetical protein [Nesterenkonia sandarakina]NYJ15676.1 hypothetical protein [Nesterenkonia sandarakina]
MSNPPQGEQPGVPGGQSGQPGGYGANPSGGYGGQPGGDYPAQQGGYPSQQGGYPVQQGGYPAQQGGGQGAPASKYGTDPYAPGSYGGPVAEPKKYSLLKTMTLVSLAVYVLSSLPGLFLSGDATRQEMITGMEQQGMTAAEAAEAADLFGGLLTGFIWVSLIVGVGLYLLVFFGLQKNKNWARITGIVFAILGIVFTMIGVIGADPLTLVLALAHVGVAAYWLVLAFSSEVKTYLAQFRR